MEQISAISSTDWDAYWSRYKEVCLIRSIGPDRIYFLFDTGIKYFYSIDILMIDKTRYKQINSSHMCSCVYRV